MDSIKNSVIEVFILFLANGKVLKTATKSVGIMMDSDIENTAKHDKVLGELKELGGDFSETLLDVVIKLVLMMLQSKMTNAKV